MLHSNMATDWREYHDGEVGVIANQGPVSTIISSLDSMANKQTNGEKPTIMANATDDANRNFSSSAKEHFTAALENDLRILALEQIVGPDLDFPNLYNLENSTNSKRNNKSRKKYATTDLSAMGIDLTQDPSTNFQSPDGDTSSTTTTEDESDDCEKKKKKPDLFADIEFIDDGVEEIDDTEDDEDDDDAETDDVEDEEGGDCDSDDDGTIDDDEKVYYESTDRDSELECFDPGTESQNEDLDTATLTRGSGTGFLSYYASLEASAARYMGVGSGESPASSSIQSVCSDSEADARGVSYEPLQHQTPYNSEQQTCTDSSTDCESTYEMLYKSFSMRQSQEHELEEEQSYLGRTLSPYEGQQPDYGYSSETSYEEKTPGDVSRDKYLRGKAGACSVPKTLIKGGYNKPGASSTSTATTNTVCPGKGVTKSLSLPPGWREVTDSSGTYYWHVPSGTTQWSPPSPVPQSKAKHEAGIPKRWSTGQNYSHLRVGQPGPSSDPDHLQDFQASTLRYASLNIASTNNKLHNQNQGKKEIRFHVRSLGWVEMDEVDLSPGKSSVAVNNCIRQLSYRKNDIRDTAGIWGEGKDMYMILEEDFLKLIDVADGSVLNSQSVCDIRVWGVGRDNGRDFAYVAKDKGSKKFKCHVFRCDIPAKAIANALHEICSKVMRERRKTNAISMVTQGHVHPHTTHVPQSSRPFAIQRRDLEKIESLPNQVVDFPTPKAEPTTVFRAHYVGSMMVPKANGMETLNSTIANMTSQPMEQWQLCRVEVATSTITVTNIKTKEIAAEHRVRFLSFLGIGPDIRQFAYIMCNGKNQFCCHVFQCEHSAGGLAKTIEAACKLRYQKCLDATPNSLGRSNQNGNDRNWSLGPIMNSVHSLFGKFGSIKRNQNNKIKKDMTVRADG